MLVTAVAKGRRHSEEEEAKRSEVSSMSKIMLSLRGVSELQVDTFFRGKGAELDNTLRGFEARCVGHFRVVCPKRKVGMVARVSGVIAG